MEDIIYESGRSDIEESEVLSLMYLVQTSYTKTIEEKEKYNNNDETERAVRKTIDKIIASQDDEKFIREVVAFLLKRYGYDRVREYFEDIHGFQLAKLFYHELPSDKEDLPEYCDSEDYDPLNDEYAKYFEVAKTDAISEAIFEIGESSYTLGLDDEEY